MDIRETLNKRDLARYDHENIMRQLAEIEKRYDAHLAKPFVFERRKEVRRLDS